VERLTFIDSKGWYINDQSIPYDERRRGEEVDRLAAYEDTGLTPEEIVTLQASFQELKKEAVPLMKAKIEERLLVLPCKPGTEIFGHCHIRNAQPISHSFFYPPYVPTLGVDAWLTREEAEAALKEQEG